MRPQKKCPSSVVLYCISLLLWIIVLIKVTETLIENTEYKDIISKHLIIDNLNNLLRDLIIKHIEHHPRPKLFY